MPILLNDSDAYWGQNSILLQQIYYYKASSYMIQRLNNQTESNKHIAMYFQFKYDF